MHDFPARLVTKRTILRRIQLTDAAGWKSYNNAIAKKMPWPHVPSIVYARNELLHYAAMWEKGTHYVYSVLDKKTGKVIGDFHLKGIRGNRAEYGHALHPSVWGTGITYETLDAMKTMTKQRGITLWGKVEEENVRSWKSLEKYNARFMGRRTFTVGNERKQMRVYEL